MEDELWQALYPLVLEEHSRRPRRKRVRFNDGVILLLALWAVLHDRPISWACRARNWRSAPGGEPPWAALPSPATMSRRLRTASVQLLLEQVFCRLLHATRVLEGLCLCRRIDSKPLPVGGFTKDHDARRRGVRLRVHHVDARRAEPRDHEVAPPHVRVRRVRAQRRAARVPAEVVQLVAGERQVEPPDRGA